MLFRFDAIFKVLLTVDLCFFMFFVCYLKDILKLAVDFIPHREVIPKKRL